MTQPITIPKMGMAPDRMDHHERMRLRAAAFRATRLYPGPVGDVLSRELLTWEEFGYRLGGSSVIMQLMDHILKTPLPDPNPLLGKGKPPWVPLTGS